MNNIKEKPAATAVIAYEFIIIQFAIELNTEHHRKHISAQKTVII